MCVPVCVPVCVLVCLPSVLQMLSTVFYANVHEWHSSAVLAGLPKRAATSLLQCDGMSVNAVAGLFQGGACFLQAKRRKAEELKELARSIRDKNARVVSPATSA